MLDYANIHFLLYLLTVFIIYVYYYFSQLKRAELEKITLKGQLSEVKVNILKYQLHPHFFFNTLNSISSLINTDKALAQNTIADFSDFLREIVYLKDVNFLSLSEELPIIKKYLDIMQIRFSNHLKVNMEIDENLERALIPSLIMQPILENSFQHGYSYNHTSITITISIKKNNENLEIVVKNTGTPLANDFKYGTGLSNTIKRLETLYEDQFSFSINNAKNNLEVITKMVFPLKYKD